MTMTLTSPAFGSGSKVPSRFTCDGADVSPPLAWSGAPEGTRSFAIVCSDADAPGGVWYHWAICDIAPTETAFAEHHAPASMTPRQALNDFKRPGYGGPCPPPGHGRHRYRFRLYALGVDQLELPANPRCRDVEAAAEARAMRTADLIGYYSR
jgi:Raf kinase inhibitor-like YbhB/YbcL family protein